VEASELGGTIHPIPAMSAHSFDAAWPTAQEVAIRALRHLDRFTSDEHMVRWCCRVAINAHIDAVRRGSRLVAEPSQEAAAPLNVAETVEGRLALHAALAHVAGLSPEDQALLLDPPIADTRKEAVRLAVRRHRLRARLTAMLEGVLAGIPVLRRLHADSFPVRVAMVAAPIVAALTALPFIAGAGSGGSLQTDQRTERAAVHAASLPGRRAAPSAHLPGAAGDERSARDAGGTPSRTIVALHPAGTSVGVRYDDKPPGTPLFCAQGYVNLCFDTPGPYIPLTPPPVPGDPAPAN
jgi:hypothetical protein